MKKILFVDDDADMREVVSIGLAMEGFTIITAKDGFEGLQVAAKERPDLIVTDAAMPNLDGVEMTQRLRSDSKFQGMPVILITGFGSDLQRRAVSAGADQVLIKPVSAKILVSHIHHLLSDHIDENS